MSCLPKVAFVRTCPPSHIRNASIEFDTAIWGALESILGGPLSDKASLPCSHSGWSQSSQRSAPAFLDSSLCSRPLVSRMLGHLPTMSLHSTSAMSAIANADSRSDWQSLDDIDIPIRQQALSISIDKAA